MTHAHRFIFYPQGKATADGGKHVCDCGVERFHVTRATIVVRPKL